MKNLSSFSFLLMFSVLLFSCDSDNDTEEVVPAAQAELNRSIAYSYSEPQSADIVAHGGNVVQAYASIDSERLNVSIGVPFPAGNDVVSFSINKAQLQTNYKGVYPLKSVSAPNTGSADLMYYYRKDGSSSTIYMSNSHAVEGQFEITHYDAQHNLISGTYRVVLRNTFDPKASQLNQSDIRRCDITITGSFANVKIEA